ncbi:MAG: NAD(P)/FAD-dependent oxidoreductase, partial [Proteobacteria bacterium]|nr:NAD(P)/FAD-dependent oxidoreductase [Pseudomonadota bacterium]
MLDRTDTAAAMTDAWLTQFNRALAEGGAARLRSLFQPDSYWRDVLALTWTFSTLCGADEIVPAFAALARKAGLEDVRIAADRAPPRQVTRAGTPAIEAIVTFETAQGRGSGIVRLIPDDDGEPKAWTLLTALDEIKGHEERLGRERPRGEAYSRDFRGPNWLDLRQAAAEYADRDPDVLVVGGGQAGLTIAARLTQLGIDTLVVDREERIGDNWRKRYHALTLHNQVQVNHLPYMPFPPNWPTYIPKDKLANWFEAYVEAMELNFWTATEFLGGGYDNATGRWTVRLNRNGTERMMHPRHVVIATGVSGIPNLPDIPSLKAFKGEVV